MKVTLVITVAVLNVSWTAAWICRTGTPAPSHELKASIPAAADPPPRPEAVRRGEASASAAAPFHWHQLESTDYPTYIANLRAIGCPELTIRDIIIADVRAQLRGPSGAPLRRASHRAGATLPPADSSPDPAGFSAEERRVLTALGMLDPGPWSDVSDATQASGRAETGEAVPFVLPPTLESKRAMLTEWHRGYTARHDAWQQRLAGRVPDAKEMAEFWQILDERQQQLDRMLSPDEREEFDVQNSPVALELRETLREIEVNAEEYQALYRAKMESEGALAAAEEDHTDEQVGQFEVAAARILGPERAAMLRHAREAELPVPSTEIISHVGAWTSFIPADASSAARDTVIAP